MLPLHRDAAAETLIEQSLEAMGGAGIIKNNKGWLVDAELHKEDGTLAAKAHWEQFKGELRIEQTHADGTTSLYTSGHGKSTHETAQTSVRLPHHVTASWILPSMIATTLQKELAATDYSLTYVNTARTDGSTEIDITSHASRIDELVLSQVWLISNTTLLPTSVTYHRHDIKKPSRFVTETQMLSDYRSVDGVMIPYSSVATRNGKVLWQTVLTSVKTIDSIPDDRFSAMQ